MYINYIKILYKIENKQCIKTAALAIEVAQKLIGLHDTYRWQEPKLTAFYNYVFTVSKSMVEARYQRKLTAVLFLENCKIRFSTTP